jgi:hypothetical protein
VATLVAVVAVVEWPGEMVVQEATLDVERPADAAATKVVVARWVVKEVLEVGASVPPRLFESHCF